jgi:hypothetical protein
MTDFVRGVAVGMAIIIAVIAVGVVMAERD